MNVRDWFFIRYMFWGMLLRHRWYRWFPPPANRARRRFLELIAELHTQGYEGLRLDAGLSPSGVYWRGAVTVKDTTLRVGSYSSGSGWQLLFDWPDAKRLTVPEAAARFLTQFPTVAEAARIPDPAYVAWYRAMLAATKPHGAVYYYADFRMPPSGVGAIGCDNDDAVTIAAPPK